MAERETLPEATAPAPAPAPATAGVAGVEGVAAGVSGARAGSGSGPTCLRRMGLQLAAAAAGCSLVSSGAREVPRSRAGTCAGVRGEAIQRLAVFGGRLCDTRCLQMPVRCCDQCNLEAWLDHHNLATPDTVSTSPEHVCVHYAPAAIMTLLVPILLGTTLVAAHYPPRRSTALPAAVARWGAVGGPGTGTPPAAA